MAIATCPWCETQIPDTSFTNCPNCGGTLSFSQGSDPGPRPPNAPRELPKKFIKKIKYTNNVWTILGIVFTFAFIWTIVLSIVGIIFWRKGLRIAREELNPLMNGNAVHGTITNVSQNTSVKVNGRSPTTIEFSFEANGQKMTGDVGNLFDQASLMKRPGDKIWVVYMPDDPNQSSIWPPLT